MLKSSKNSDWIIKDNFIYRIKKRNSSTINWVCLIESCNATGKSLPTYINNLDSFSEIIPHNHNLDVTMVIKNTKMHEMKELILLGFDSIREVVHRVLCGAGFEIITAVGNFENIYRLLREFRMSIKNPLLIFITN